MPEFNVAIVERPAVRLAGISVGTSIPKAPKDCHDLWEPFVPFMEERFKTRPAVAFGASFLIDGEAGTFTYWAAVELDPDEPLPAGLRETALPAGTFASCLVTDMKDLPAAYQYLYAGDYLPPDLGPRYDAPCYELYPDDFMQTGAFTLYMPLTKKA